MTSHSIEREIFNKYKAVMIHKLGKKALSDTTINKAGKALFASWGGCFPSDRVKLQPHHYYIVNVDTHDQPGSHWLAAFCTAKRCYVWDSFGRSIIELAPKLVQCIHKSGMTLGKTDLIHHQEQTGYTSEICGQDSISWLLLVRDLGITRARNI